MIRFAGFVESNDAKIVNFTLINKQIRGFIHRCDSLIQGELVLLSDDQNPPIVNKKATHFKKSRLQ